MIQKDFLTKAIHTFQISTLKKLGYEARVALFNKSHLTKFATDYRVDFTFLFSDGRRHESKDIGRLPTEGHLLLNVRDLVSQSLGEDGIAIFHLIPERFAGQEKVEISKAELWSLFTAQDHYVEYVAENGFSAGILYQSGAFNYPPFSLEKSTLIQAPKIYVSQNIRTYMSLVHSSFSPGYHHEAVMKCCLMKQDRVVKRWTETIPAHQTRLLDFSAHVPAESLQRDDDHPDFFCFYSVCDNAVLLPNTISKNLRTGSLALEHSLPPAYYGSQMTGPTRRQSVENLTQSFLFEGMGG